MPSPVKRVKNNSGEDRTYLGQIIENGAYYQIEKQEDLKWQNSQDIQDFIASEELIVSDGSTDITDIPTAQTYMMARIPQEYPSSCAIDMENADQSITGDGWVEVLGIRKLWDFLNNYDLASANFNVPTDAVYSFDIQLKIKDIVNVARVELAIFKRETPEDDYWFVLDNRANISGDFIQLSSSTMFDMYIGDQFCIKIRLTKSDPGVECSANIDGSDDYTAWGYDYTRPIQT